jgi:hypothetical protein
LFTGFKFGAVGGLVSRNARPDNTQRFYIRHLQGLK